MTPVTVSQEDFRENGYIGGYILGVLGDGRAEISNADLDALLPSVVEIYLKHPFLFWERVLGMVAFHKNYYRDTTFKNCVSQKSLLECFLRNWPKIEQEYGKIHRACEKQGTLDPYDHWAEKHPKDVWLEGDESSDNAASDDRQCAPSVDEYYEQDCDGDM